MPPLKFGPSALLCKDQSVKDLKPEDIDDMRDEMIALWMSAAELAWEGDMTTAGYNLRKLGESLTELSQLIEQARDHDLTSTAEALRTVEADVWKRTVGVEVPKDA